MVENAEMVNVNRPPFKPHFSHSHTEVVIIGNGPAGLALSAFLAGCYGNYRHPYYVGEHPDPTVHARLNADRSKSLIDQDLTWFGDECAERINPTVGAFAALYDTLARPSANDVKPHPSCLEWRFHPERAVPHIVFGNEGIGGSWNSYDPKMETVSQAEWMSLPGYPITDFLGDEGSDGSQRVTADTVCRYMVEYATRMQLRKNYIRPRNAVVNLTRERNRCDRAWSMECGRTMQEVLCNNVVLAGGKNTPRKLNVDGEEETSNVIYDLPSLKRLLKNTSNVKQVVVVGDGISAADVVNYCLSMGLTVLHVVKRGLSELKTSIYTENHRVYRLMMGREICRNYSCLTSTRVKSISGENEVIRLEKLDGSVVEEPYTFVTACIGRVPQLPFETSVKYEFQSNYRSTTDPRLFAIGSLVGDHFVRFLIGGCMQVAQSLICDYEATLRILRPELRLSVDGRFFFGCGRQCSPFYLAVKNMCRRHMRKGGHRQEENLTKSEGLINCFAEILQTR